MLDLLKVNIRQFDETEVEEQPEIETDAYLSDDGEFDTDKFIADFESRQSTEDADNDNEEDEQEQPEETLETDTEEPETQDTPDEEEEQQAETSEKEKRTPDQAFAELRKKAESNEKYAKFLNDLAQRQGLQSPDDLMKAWEDRQMEDEAKKQGVPVDVYKRLQQLETENKQTKQQAFAERFDNEVKQTVQEYNLKDEDVNGVFEYMGKNGFINEDNTTNIPFQDAYFLANKDSILKNAEEKGKQAYLEAEKKKQETSTVNTGTGRTSTQTSGEMDVSESGILKQFAKYGIDID